MPAIKPDVALGHLGRFQRQSLEAARPGDLLDLLQQETPEPGALASRGHAQPVDIDAVTPPLGRGNTHHLLAVEREEDVTALDGSGKEHVMMGRNLASKIADVGRESRPQDALDLIEFAPEARKRSLELWPSPGGDFDIMRRVKELFDPSNLLNRGRLYRRI